MGTVLRRGAATAVLLVVGIAPPIAAGARTPVYRDPPSYKGVRTAPKTKAAPAPKPPPPVVLSEAGSFPDVLVDEAGTAHVVWNEDRGDAADVVVYCRIKRGATGCDTRTELNWEKTYGTGDGPQYNSGGPPKIVRVGGQLVAFSHRYPTGSEKPDGGGSSTVIAWTSADGGTTWTPAPAIVGKWNLTQMAVIGSEDDPTILNVGVDPLCAAPGPAALCIEAYKSGQYTPGAGNLSTASNENYYENLTKDEQGRPVVSAEDLGYNTYIRRWTGAGDPTDSATWTPPTVIGTDQSSIAGGPAGVYLMGKPQTGYGPYSVRRLNESGDQYSPGAPTVISADSDNVLGRLYQGPGGHLIAAWEQRGKGLLQRATAGSAGATPSFAPSQTLTDGDGNGQISIGAAADGGGFTAYNHTAGVVGEGQIAIGGFGNQRPTGSPGIADVPGGGVTAGGTGTNGSCSQLSFGKFIVESPSGCILKGTGARASEYVTTGELDIWGVRIIPDAGAKIVIDPRSFQLDTTGSVRVIVTAPAPIGDVLLFHGVIHRDLSKVVPGSNLFEFPTGLFKANILGFDVGADINVRLEKDGVHIPVDLKLPPAFGGFSGHAELVADRVNGLHVDSVHIRLGPIPLGVLIINKIELDYQGAGDIWSGAGSITVPAGGTLDISARFAMGAFKEATLSFTPGEPIPVGPFVYLLQFGGGFGVDPTMIDANATLGAGAAIAGEAPVKVHGDFKMTFPANGPGDFRLTGTIGVFMFDIADGSLDFQTDGYAAFRGHAGVSLGPLQVDANLDGFVDAPTGQFGASVDGTVSLCVEDPVEICADAGAAVALSNKGFAACAGFDPPDPFGGFHAGLTYPWSDWDPVYLVSPLAFSASLIEHIGACHTDEYRVAPTRARAAQAGGAPVSIPGGLPSATILVKGDGGQPKVTVTGPNGETVASDQPSQDGTVITAKGVNAAYVMLNKPKGGTWTVATQPGSVGATEIMTSQGYTPAKVKATLRGHGRSRSIAYSVTNAGHGQTISFQETGKFGSHLLGAAKGTRGTLRFRPADARPGGRRTVYALIGHAGVVTDQVRVGSYVAPAPAKPGAVRGLRARRSGTKMTVSWRAARGAARYSVVLKGAKGTRLGRLVGRKVKRLRFTAVRRDERVQVSVRALSSKLRLGPARRISSRGSRR